MLKDLTVEQLKAELIRLGLDTKGVKADLIARLEEVMNNSAESDEEQLDETIHHGGSQAASGKSSKNDVNALGAPGTSRTQSKGMPSSSRAQFTGNTNQTINEFAETVGGACSYNFKVKDIENLIRSFSGDQGNTVIEWFREFEEIAVMMKWSDIEKFIYTKRLLTGSAKIFSRTLVFKSYSDLKSKLINEFNRTVCKADIYRQLQNRMKRKSESYREYVYKMQEIASLADVDELSLVNFIVNGITDREDRKMILYGAENISELKNKLDIYERIKNRSNKPIYQNAQQLTKSSGNSGKIRCFNCGSVDHKRRDCNVGIKCFKCNGLGHWANNCTEKSNTKQTNCILTQNVKTIKIKGCQLSALVDTGSELSLIRKDSFKDLGNITLLKNSINFLGLGSGSTKSIGYFNTTFAVDNIEIKGRFHVVPKTAIRFPCIIGNDIISKVKVIIDRHVTTFYLPDEQVEIASIMNICAIDVDEIEVTGKSKSKVVNLISNYKPRSTNQHPIKMSIILNNETPIYSRPRRLPVVEKEVIKKQIEDWLEEGIIQRSNSPFASNVVVVRKKDGSPRICIDYRRVNKVTIKEPFIMPVMEDVLDKLADAQVFTTLDLKNGYFHVPMEENCKKYTAFVVEDGHFEFNKVPFGLMNAPAVFCRFINFIFRNLVAENTVETYMDDLIIYSKNEEENITKLEKVLEKAGEYGLQFNWKKCKFLKSTIDFLGHVIHQGKISPSAEKIKQVENFTEPKTIKDLQSFLGLTGAFRRFIANYSLIARPLTNLLKKGVDFKIQSNERKSIEELKTALVTRPVLHIFKQTAETEIHTDASKYDCAAVLFQTGDDQQLHPVYYYSRKNSPAEENYHSYVLETLAVYLALRKFRVYVLGRRFKVVTDCSALQQTKEKRDLPAAVSKWILYMQEFGFQIEHRTKKKMAHVDSLSRYPNVCVIQTELLVRIQKAQEKDSHIQAIKEILKEKDYENFVVEKSVLFKYVDGRKILVVPRYMEAEIIKIKHEEGHFGTQKPV